MKNTLVILLVSAIAVGCVDKKSDVKESEIILIEEPKTNEHCLYFDFDHITYYHFNLSRADSEKLFDYKTPKDSILNRIVLGDYPRDLNDSNFFFNLEKMADKIVEVDTSKYEELRKLFSNEGEEESVYEACIAYWRDILVFKKEGTTIGVAKFMFGCWRNFFLGTNCHTREFGHKDDYERLKVILNSDTK